MLQRYVLKILITLLFLMNVSFVCEGGEKREWSSKTGNHKMIARLNKITKDGVTLRTVRKGQIKDIEVPFAKLGDSDLEYLLFYMGKRGKLKEVHLTAILKAGCDLNVIDEEGHTVIYYAVVKGKNRQAYELLKKNGAKFTESEKQNLLAQEQERQRQQAAAEEIRRQAEANRRLGGMAALRGHWQAHNGDYYFSSSKVVFVDGETGKAGPSNIVGVEEYPDACVITQKGDRFQAETRFEFTDDFNVAHAKLIRAKVRDPFGTKWGRWVEMSGSPKIYKRIDNLEQPTKK